VGHLGFYDLDKRPEALGAKGDPLEALSSIVPFESFRAEVEAVVRLAPEESKSNAGRKAESASSGINAPVAERGACRAMCS
jgi:hypothetical protein